MNATILIYHAATTETFVMEKFFDSEAFTAGHTVGTRRACVFRTDSIAYSHSYQIGNQTKRHRVQAVRFGHFWRKFFALQKLNVRLLSEQFGHYY